MLIPSFVYEKKLLKKGYKIIAGVDEVGRGSLAGPILAVAIILSIKETPNSKLIRDSKSLSEKQREEAFLLIKKSTLSVGIGLVSNKYIDKYGINRANILVCQKAVKRLSLSPDFLLIDGNHSMGFSMPNQYLVKGESASISIAAASIVAKVTRDNLMKCLAKKYNYYLFEKNKGYGTNKHIQMIKKHYICPAHRRSFVKNMVKI